MTPRVEQHDGVIAVDSRSESEPKKAAEDLVIDPKLFDLARMGYRYGPRRRTPEARVTKAELRSTRKAERDRKRDQRRKRR